MKKVKDRFTKVEKSWMLYDLTLNGYATIVLTAIFPIYFNSVLGQNTLGLEMKGYASSLVMLVATVSSPILGLLGDRKDMKKKFWGTFVIIGVAFTVGLVFAQTWQLLLLFFVLSNICYNSAMLFNDSFITDVTTPERMHRVSTWAFAIGYFGGGFILLVITAVLLFTMGTSNVLPVKIAFALTALWWLGFSIPMFLNVKQVHYNEDSLGKEKKKIFSQLWQTIKSIAREKKIFYFMIAYFFYIDGVGTVIAMATSYGSTLNLSSALMIVAIITTQVVAIPFSILYGKLANKFSAIRMIGIAIATYIVICVLGFYMGFIVESSGAVGTAANTAAIAKAQIIFWIVAGLVGTAQGGIQALSRSQFGQMVPKDKSNEYFGFFNIFNRFASIMGSFLMAFVTMLTGKSSFGLLSIIALFIVGGIMLLKSHRVKTLNINNT